MPKLHKIYILVGLIFILIVTTFVAALPSLTGFLADWRKPEASHYPPPGFRRTETAAPPVVVKATPPKAARFDSDSEQGKFERQINQLLTAKNFARIDKIAREIRAGKKRFSNGRWALNRLYNALTTIYATESSEFQTDEAWRERIESLKSWKQKFPDSATARIALAAAYSEYGWFARGNGYADSVSEESGRLLHERLTLAENELYEARSLAERCPQWYREKLFLAMTGGAPDAEFEALFDEAVNFEPNYYPYYSIRSDSLKPKWGGSMAEWQKYLDSIPGILARHGSDEGNMTYLLVALGSMRDHTVIRNYEVISASTVRRGFEDVSRKHGIDDALLNQYAFLSVILLDIASAKEAMERIGDNPDPAVWSKEAFNKIKKDIADNKLSPDESTQSF